MDYLNGLVKRHTLRSGLVIIATRKIRIYDVGQVSQNAGTGAHSARKSHTANLCATIKIFYCGGHLFEDGVRFRYVSAFYVYAKNWKIRMEKWRKIHVFFRVFDCYWESFWAGHKSLVLRSLFRNRKMGFV